MPRRSDKNRKKPASLKDFICHQAFSLTHPTKSDKKKWTITLGSLFLLFATLSYHKLSSKHKAFASSVLAQLEPATYQEAIKCPERCEAMQAEISALELNQTWTVTDLPSGKVPIG